LARENKKEPFFWAKRGAGRGRKKGWGLQNEALNCQEKDARKTGRKNGVYRKGEAEKTGWRCSTK